MPGEGFDKEASNRWKTCDYFPHGELREKSSGTKGGEGRRAPAGVKSHFERTDGQERTLFFLNQGKKKNRENCREKKKSTGDRNVTRRGFSSKVSYPKVSRRAIQLPGPSTR